jgi:hypothetical protein
MPDWTFNLTKLVHIGALIFWIGPTMGAWWMLRAANYRFDEPGMVSQFLYQVFLRLLWVEHLAFAVLLSSGAAMAWLHGRWGASWLEMKLVLVFTVVVPLELVDIWLGHIRLPALFRHRHPSRPYSAREMTLLDLYHGRLTRIGLRVLPVVVALIMWLAVSKGW